MVATTATMFTFPKLYSSSTTLNPTLSSSFSISHFPFKVQPPLRKVQPLLCTKPRISAIISVGDKLPNSTLSHFRTPALLETLSVSDLTTGKKVIFFAVPGAFTPTCSQKHLPDFVEKSKELKAKGVDRLVCISVNDAYVMRAWKEDLEILDDDVLLLSDGNLEFTEAIGCEVDLSDKPDGLGVRSRRYAMLVEDGVVKILNLEEGGAFNVSSAEDMLKAL